MFRKQIVISILALACSFTAYANPSSCVEATTTVELEGVVTYKTKMFEPHEFGWVPANGAVRYPVLVTQSPLCYFDNGEFVGNVHVIQLANFTAYHDEAMGSGVPVRVRGKVSPPETAHHLERLFLIVESQKTAN